MSMVHRIDGLWLPDDTEEDLVGADWHQYAIDVAYDGTRDVADLEHLPWHVGNQLTLVGWTTRGPWRPAPAIAIYPTAGPELRKEMVAKEEGPPALVIEVASPTTWAYDVNDVNGKAAGYLGMGVPYYLVFDPTGELWGTPCRGWRQEGGRTRAWRPEKDGSYRCAVLGIAFRPEGIILRVLDRAGRPVPTRGERLVQLVEQTKEIAALRAALDRLRGGRLDPS